MKMTVITDEGTVLEYHGRDAENMMFYSQIGCDFFNTLPTTCVLKDHFGSLQAYVKECCVTDSFRDMFLRALISDTAEDWNAITDAHYGGRKGLTEIAQELADNLRDRMGKSDA